MVKAEYVITPEMEKDVWRELDELRAKKKYDDNEYTESDIILVRTTDEYPENRVMSPISENTLVKKCNSSILSRTYARRYGEDNLISIASYDMYYRDTLHFTENGLVSSHMYGSFDGKNFIFLEPLDEQIGKGQILNFAGQDTVIQGSIRLSGRATVLVTKDKYQEYLNEFPDLEDYNVILYTGNPEIVVMKTLMDMGYVPEVIGSHYIIESETSERIVNLNRKLADNFGVEGNAKHCYMPIYEQDNEMSERLTGIFDQQLLNFIIAYYEMKIDTNDFISDIAINIVESLSEEELINAVQVFNKTIESMLEDNVIGSAKEVINFGLPDVLEYYHEKKRLGL